MDKIIHKLNKESGNPPFLIVSSVRQMNGPYVMPTLWYNYFFKDSAEEYSYLYDGRFNTASEVKGVYKESLNVVAIIDRAPEKMNRKVVSLRDILPLDLAYDTSVLPYDPANGMEFEAVLNMALKKEDKNCVVYVSAHDTTDVTPEPDVPVNERDVVKGMYLYKSSRKHKSDARILASGRSLLPALKIAECIENEFGVCFEVWSCPSYTMISREINQKYAENIVNNRDCFSTTHIHECLKEEIPTIALTHYNSLVCEQVSKYFRKGFMALGKVGGKEQSTWGDNEVTMRCIYHLVKNNLISNSDFILSGYESPGSFD
ncbi:hypothetical protein QC589_01850 [Halomonas elongata]|uniref:transketolase-like TK C-terminal-containing protein n=1 Tax=Halomonas elongata TaxID=2746 RepID=UPI003356836E